VLLLIGKPVPLCRHFYDTLAYATGDQSQDRQGAWHHRAAAALRPRRREASFWTGIGAPKNTPPEIVEKLNKEINTALADPKMKARLTDLGVTGLPGSPADFGTLIASETEKWGRVIRAANIKAE
jgi:Tripartite tricarboxylate transporter family receptor